jgi:hypothetical protein
LSGKIRVVEVQVKIKRPSISSTTLAPNYSTVTLKSDKNENTALPCPGNTKKIYMVAALIIE